MRPKGGGKDFCQASNFYGFADLVYSVAHKSLNRRMILKIMFLLKYGLFDYL